MYNVALLEAGIFCITILLLVTHQYRISLLQFPDERTFKKILLIIVANTALETICKLHLPPHIFSIELKYALNIVSAIFALFIPYFWNIFIHYRVIGSVYYFRKYSIPLTIPLLMGILFCITCFYKIREGMTEPHPLDAMSVSNTISILYLIMASVISYKTAKKSTTKTAWRLNMYFCWVMVFPMLAIIAQQHLHNYDIPLTNPVYTIIFLHIYASKQNLLITTDSLTGFNNERRLNSFLRDKTADLGPDQRLFLLELTLDNMRLIRKKFGRKKAKEVIVAFANFIRTQLANDSSFLARYQKYSFAIVLEKKNWEDVESFCNTLVAKSVNGKFHDIVPQAVSFSINYSEFGKAGINNVIELLNDTKNNCYKPATSIASSKTSR